MKKIIAIVIALFTGVVCAFGFAGCGDKRETLQIYTNAGFAPYEYMNEYGEVVGIDIDIMKEVGEILGYNVVINDIEFDQILVEVAKDPLSIGAAGMTQEPERDELALPSISYATSVQYVIVPSTLFTDKQPTDTVSVSELTAITKKAIGVQEGTTGDFLISDAISGTEDDDGNHVKGDLEGSGIECMKYSNAIVASGDIGEAIGAVVIDKLPAESICKGNENLKCFMLDSEPEQYVIYFNKEAGALRDKVNKVLEKMIAGGVIDFYTLKHSGGII